MKNILKQVFLGVLIGGVALVTTANCEASCDPYRKRKSEDEKVAEALASVAVLGSVAYLGMWALAYSPKVPYSKHTVYTTTYGFFGPERTAETFYGDYNYTPLQHLARWYFL